MNRALKFALVLLFLPALAYGGAAFQGLDKISPNLLVAHFSSGDRLVADSDNGPLNVSFTTGRTFTDTWTYTRSGKSITWNFTSQTGTNCTGTATIAATAAIPTAFRPTNSLRWPVIIDGNGIQTTPGELVISSGGNVTFGKTAGGATFTSGQTCGYFASSVTYSVP